jgi:hypothetical protein
MSEHGPSGHAPRQPLTSQANGFTKPVRGTAWESQGQIEQPYLIPDHGNDLHKKASGDMSANSSEHDGVQEYYKSHTNKKKGPVSVNGKPKKRPTKAGVADPNVAALELDKNNWIHRDKLRAIETKELEDAGYRVGRASRSTSRSQSATRRSRDRRGSEATELVQNGDERAEVRRLVSPIPAEDEDEEVEEQYRTWGSTTHPEFAPDDEFSLPRLNNHGVRPSTSRIPLPRTSGIPVPAALAERDAPLPRSRASSKNWSGDAIAVNGARVRSGSVGSEALLDGPDGERQVTPPYGHTRNTSSASASPKSPQKSPMKAKNPVKLAPTSGARKTSVQKTQPKNRQVSGTSSAKRPGTSGGSAPRPTTSHRPEGDPPWLATMYKPDPRLPPDQQIIPTHAKRMQQEQWQNEGRVGPMYDTDLQLPNHNESQDKRLSQMQPIDIEKAQQDAMWPLPSPTKQPSFDKVETNTNKALNAEQGGYKLTPTIPQSSRAPSPQFAPPIVPASEPQPKITRIPEPEEEVNEKKACCCIVM